MFLYKLLNEAALTTAFMGILSTELTNVVNVVEFDTLNVCKQADDTYSGTVWINSNSSISDSNGIIDKSEVDSNFDKDRKFNLQNLDDDGDRIIDLIEIGFNPDTSTNGDCDSSDGYDYQVLNFAN